ncbi:intracellular septation protein A [Candidatus Liberibacter solanacearum CLso-ZC1]|uniref:Inner membrane-spanning protein YciB n=1 Tax=Liberibacter solanacearum (strain CLso-ZC1) TaxID=658172 RepID=E4UBY4_LIBSC|nr:septation protein A [Candidatus Liberibacter solanacearum]ADR51874.1 intracellular septation protein A [Candidatus Liberibacter solanacearum CLso-ZC1]
MSASQSQHKLIRFLLEFAPGIIFWLCNLYGNQLILRYPVLSQFGGVIFFSTVLLMVLTGISLGVFWVLFHEIRIMPIVSGVFVLVLGGLTVWFRDEAFIKMKPTLFYFIFSITLFIGYLFKKSFVKLLLSQVMSLDSIGWRKLTLRWAFFSLFLSFLNEIVWRNFSTETWVFFKTVGTFPILLIFSIAQINIINKHSISCEEERE